MVKARSIYGHLSSASIIKFQNDIDGKEYTFIETLSIQSCSVWVMRNIHFCSVPPSCGMITTHMWDTSSFLCLKLRNFSTDLILPNSTLKLLKLLCIFFASRLNNQARLNILTFSFYGIISPSNLGPSFLLFCTLSSPFFHCVLVNIDRKHFSLHHVLMEFHTFASPRKITSSFCRKR